MVSLGRGPLSSVRLRLACWTSLRLAGLDSRSLLSCKLSFLRCRRVVGVPAVLGGRAELAELSAGVGLSLGAGLGADWAGGAEAGAGSAGSSVRSMQSTISAYGS